MARRKIIPMRRDPDDGEWLFASTEMIGDSEYVLWIKRNGNVRFVMRRDAMMVPCTPPQSPRERRRFPSPPPRKQKV